MITKYRGKHYKKKYIIDIHIDTKLIDNIKQKIYIPINKAIIWIDCFDNWYDNVDIQSYSKKQIKWLIKQVDDNYYNLA